MSPETNTAQKQQLAWHMIRESSVHAAKEEQVRGVSGFVVLVVTVTKHSCVRSLFVCAS